MRAKKNPRSITKLTPPGTKGVLHRERLFHLLDKGRDFPVIYLSSPPGSGKTMLVSSYLEARTLPCLWYRIDEGDNDIATFFHYMSLALRQATPRSRKPLPPFSPEYVKSINTFARTYFEELYGKLQVPCMCVLDNYQEVPFSSAFHEMIAHGLEVVPGNLNVVIVSRKDPPASFARLRAGEKMCFFGWNDLRFNFQEFKDLVRMKGQETITDRNLDHLYSKLEGWPAGITLVIESLRMGTTDQKLVTKIPPTEIFNYFAHEIFERIEKETQDFLLRTAFLPRMTPQMAEGLSGSSHSGQILSDLHGNNYFTERYIQKEPVYQYHPLFRDFLLSLQRDFFSSNEVSRRQETSAELLEKYGYIEDAARLFCDSRSVQGLSRIIRNHAPSFIEEGRHLTLLDWFSCIPDEMTAHDPWLLYWKGISLLPFKSSESKIHFEGAFQRFHVQKDAAGVFLAWAGLVDAMIYGTDSLTQLDSWLFMINDLLKEYKGFPSVESEAAVTSNVLRALSLRKPPSFNTDEWIHRMNQIVHKTTASPVKIKAITNLACFLYSCGEFQKMGIHIVAINEMLKHTTVPGLLLHTINWIKAAYFNVLSEYEDCQRTLTEGLALADATGIHVMDFMLMGHGVLSALKKQDIPTAERFLRKMEPLSGIAKPWEASFFYYTAAWEAFYKEDIARASFLSEKCLDMCRETGNPWTLSLAHLQRAYLLFRLEDNRNTEQHLAKARHIGIETRNTFTLFCCVLSKAYFALHRKEYTRALDALRKGLHKGRTEGFFNIYMSPPDLLEKICVQAIESGIEVTYVQEVIKRNGIFPDSTTVGVESWPYPLRIRTMGGFELERNTTPVRFAGKIQQKPLLLMKALIASRRHEIKEAQIADLLWPESAGDAAHSAFTTNLSRLRKLLGIENAIKLQDGRVSLDTRCCWVDAWAFERCADRAETLWKAALSEKTCKDAIRLTERAISLYKGHFLPSDEDRFWTITTRDRLQDKFHNMVSRFGEYLQERGKLKEAVLYFERALEKDELAEIFYQQLMVCYDKLGQQSRAVRVYKRCNGILSESLGICPSEKTEAIYRNVSKKLSFS